MGGRGLPRPRPALAAAAQTDEIQVYDGGLAAEGHFNLTLHNNFTPSGLNDAGLSRAPSSPTGRSTAYPSGRSASPTGSRPGSICPSTATTRTSGWGIDGFKLRALFAVPERGRRDVRLRRQLRVQLQRRSAGTPRTFTSEIRPDPRLAPQDRCDIIVNPILDTAYDGFGNLDFVPSTRVAFNVAPKWQVAVEQYADFGPLQRVPSVRSEQSHKYLRGGRPLRQDLGLRVRRRFRPHRCLRQAHVQDDPRPRSEDAEAEGLTSRGPLVSTTGPPQQDHGQREGHAPGE